MTDLEISTRLAKDRVEGREEKRPNALDRVTERMMPEVTNKQEHETQLLIIRLLVAVVIPVLACLSTIEFVTKGNVNPFIMALGGVVGGALATMLKTNGPSDKPKA